MVTDRDLKHLRIDRFSKRFAKWLFNKRPEWLQYATGWEHTVDGLQVNTLAVNIPSENPAVPEPLTIDIDLGRIMTIRWLHAPPGSLSFTGRWDWDHVIYMPALCEVHTQLKDDPDYGFRVTLDDVDAIIEERVVAYMSSSGYGAWRINEARPKFDGNSYYMVARPDVDGPSDDWLVVRSWRGTYDRIQGDAYRSSAS